MVDRVSWSQVQGERETVHQISSGPNSLAPPPRWQHPQSKKTRTVHNHNSSVAVSVAGRLQPRQSVMPNRTHTQNNPAATAAAHPPAMWGYGATAAPSTQPWSLPQVCRVAPSLNMRTLAPKQRMTHHPLHDSWECVTPYNV